MSMNNKLLLISLGLILLGASVASAAVTAAEADRLGKDLTPMGAEKAGNADGTIPEWTGGLTEPLPGWPNKDNYRPNPYADDKVQFTITKDNMAQYADKLPEAAKAMLKAYPDKFKMNVYPTRRTAAYPQWLYDAIKKTATTAKLINDGNGIEGAWGAIPFPIPSNGNHIIWNHLLRYSGVYRTARYNEGVYYSDGTRVEYKRDNHMAWPYYMPEKEKDGKTWKYSHTTTYPSRDSGEGLMAIDDINPVKSPRAAWQYDPGERRVRRAPNLAFDTPDLPINTIDDYDIFSGSPERYDWKLVGKKEMYVPYNNNEVSSPRRNHEEMTPVGFLPADLLRYELHRVWVVEATVKADKRHIYAKRVFYVDEDSWSILVSDKYDGSGNLWRVSFAYPIVAAEEPLTGHGPYVHVDLKKDAYYTVFTTGGSPSGYDLTKEPPKDKFYTPSALRRRGR